MVVVKKKKGESEDRLISRFKKKVVESGVLQEARDRKRFISEGEKRKKDKARIKHSIKMNKKRDY